MKENQIYLNTALKKLNTRKTCDFSITADNRIEVQLDLVFSSA